MLVVPGYPGDRPLEPGVNHCDWLYELIGIYPVVRIKSQQGEEAFSPVHVAWCRGGRGSIRLVGRKLIPMLIPVRHQLSRGVVAF